MQRKPSHEIGVMQQADDIAGLHYGYRIALGREQKFERISAAQIRPNRVA